MIEQGDHLPEFSFSATNNLNGSTADFSGKNVVLYFYPKDSTPGCTSESKHFRDLHQKFCDQNTIILGISRDSMESHERFKQKLALPFELISDKDGAICELLEVIKEKSLFGKKYKGIERSTFVIDHQGVVRGIWRKVKIKNHAQEVLSLVEAIGRS